MSKNLSVIIPVYKAENFLKRAIESVLIQLEVSEIVLVEDCSPDNSIEICKKYAEKYPELIKLYFHPERKNLGAGATRNLGIKKSKGDYIAFLDADDFYLPNRFKETLEIFNKYPEIDGVYGSLGTHFENNDLREIYKNEPSYQDVVSFKSKVEPQKLFEAIAINHESWIHLNTLTIKKCIAEKVGYFDEKFKQGQDTHFVWKLAAVGNLISVSTNEAIAMRGVHEKNRIYNKKESGYFHSLLTPSILEWGKDINVIKNNKKIFIKNKHLLYLKLYAYAQNKYLARLLYIKDLIFDKYKFIPKDIVLEEILKTIFLVSLLKFIMRNPFFFLKPKHYEKFSNVLIGYDF